MAYTFSVQTGTLPNGLSLTTNGILSGIPTLAGNYSFTIRATDSTGAYGDRPYTLQINEDLGTITPANIPNTAWTVNWPYPSTTFSITSGGTAPFVWSLVGTVPTGLAINANTGVLSGTPTSTGSYSFVIKATDAAGDTSQTASQSLTINDVIVISPTSLPSGTVTASYSATLTASGGTP